MSRSDSRSTATRPSRDGGRGGEGFGEKVKPALQIVKVGMRVPERPNLALTSNPPMPSPSQFPTPPSSRGKTDADQNASWPLPEKL